MTNRLYYKNARINLLGKAIIPVGTEEIANCTYDKNQRLRSISIPGTVKKIGNRAFADCVNLKKVDLAEGIEAIGQNAFTGCTALEELTMPDSLQNMDGWAFYNAAGLKKPVYNRSGTILYAYPYTAKEKVFAVPAQVKKINPAAFLYNPELEEVILPEAMEVIGFRSFLRCGIKRIVIPKAVKRIESKAFWDCKDLEEVVLLGKNTIIEDCAFYGCPMKLKIVSGGEYQFDQWIHLLGGSFLCRVQAELPKQVHLEDPSFIRLAKGCAEGDVDAMWKFADYLTGLGTADFYTYAANFWRYRAYQGGHATAKKWLSDWIRDNPGKLMPSVLNESLSGSYDGKILRSAGFLFFDPERSYSVEKPDGDGVVEVSSWSSTEGPDEDGFGWEECYDWWYLDANLNPLPGVGWVHDYSPRDKRNNTEKFRLLHDKAAELIRIKNRL